MPGWVGLVVMAMDGTDEKDELLDHVDDYPEADIADDDVDKTAFD